MLRIDVTELASVVTLHLQGRVIGPWVEELEKSCNEFLNRGSALRLELAKVSFVSGDGIDLLRRLLSSQVALSNCPLFVAEQLKTFPGGEPLR